GVQVSDRVTFCRLLATVNPVNGCTVMARRSALMRAGLFNEALRYTQDYEMWLRLTCFGVRFDYLPEPLTQYRFHSGMGTRRNQAAMLAECAAIQAAYREPITRMMRELGG